MAATSYGVNDALAVKLWSKALAVEALKKTYIFKFMGTSADSLVQIKTETQKSAGDKITYGLRMQATGDGVLGDGILEGNEESLTTYSDALLIDQLRHAHRVSGRMSEQRVLFDARSESRDSLSDWFANRFDTAFANQIAGNTGETRLQYTGNNATLAPTLFALPNARTNENQITSADPFTLTQIDKAVEKARTVSPLIRPLKVDGEDKYVAFLHDYQVTSLRTNTSAGQWFDIQKAAMTGGKVKDNPIYSGALGEYNGAVLHRWNRVPASPAVANTRRAVLAGAQAVTAGFGQDNNPNKFTWVEKLFDFDNQYGVAVGTIFGFKKTQFNNADFSVVVMPSYAVAS